MNAASSETQVCRPGICLPLSLRHTSFATNPKYSLLIIISCICVVCARVYVKFVLAPRAQLKGARKIQKLTRETRKSLWMRQPIVREIELGQIHEATCERNCLRAIEDANDKVHVVAMCLLYARWRRRLVAYTWHALRGNFRN